MRNLVVSISSLQPNVRGITWPGMTLGHGLDLLSKTRARWLESSVAAAAAAAQRGEGEQRLALQLLCGALQCRHTRVTTFAGC